MLLKRIGTGPAIHVIAAKCSSPRKVTEPVHRHRKMKAAQLTSPNSEDAMMLRVSLCPGLFRQISGDSKYFP
jgi:hypothetical protein